MGESLEIQTVNLVGNLVAKPVANGFAELASYRLGAGRLFFGSLVTALKLNPTNTVLNRVVPGFGWKLQARIGPYQSQRTLKAIAASAGVNPVNDGRIDWTFNDGTPIARNVLVEATESLDLVFGVDVTDVAQIPVTVEAMSGALVGVDLPIEWKKRPELLGLVVLP